MSSTVSRFSIPLTIRRVSQVIVEHRPINEEVEETINGVIVPAKPRDLKGYEVKFGLSYWKVHSTNKINGSDILVYRGKDHKAISVSDYADNGFYKAIFEEIK